MARALTSIGLCGIEICEICIMRGVLRLPQSDCVELKCHCDEVLVRFTAHLNRTVWN